MIGEGASKSEICNLKKILFSDKLLFLHKKVSELGRLYM